MNAKQVPPIVIIVSALLAPGCWSRSTPDTLHTYKQSERERRIEELLNEHRKRIDELNARMEGAAENVREEGRRAVEDLRTKHRDASERLRQLKNATNTAWGEVNAGLQGSLDRFKQALDAARELSAAPEPQDRK